MWNSEVKIIDFIVDWLLIKYFRCGNDILIKIYKVYQFLEYMKFKWIEEQNSNICKNKSNSIFFRMAWISGKKLNRTFKYFSVKNLKRRKLKDEGIRRA